VDLPALAVSQALVIRNVQVFDGDQLIPRTTVAGYRPARKSFVAGPAWKEFVLPFTAFGVDGRGIMGISGAAGPKPGTFELRCLE
jgi:hypothetical protein